jgi:preprotein translocase subunit SecA
MSRISYPDCVYKTEAAKFKAVVNEIEQMHGQGGRFSSARFR